MSQEKLYQISFPSARFIIGVGALELLGETEWVVKWTGSITDWMMGIAVQDVETWVRQRGGTVKELRDSQARIAGDNPAKFLKREIYGT